MQSDLELKRKRIAWESPKTIAVIVAATAVIIGPISGILGYRIARTPPPAPGVSINVPLGTTMTVPPAQPAARP